MSNSHGYKGNPILHAMRARRVEQQEAEYAAAVATLAEAEAAAAQAIPDSLVDAGIILPARRRPSKAATTAASEQE